jgi:uncharacterized protein
MLIQELAKKECVELLTRLRFARLGCAYGNQPYVVPIYFAYDDGHLYTCATGGQKIEWMRANPLVCVQADEIVDRYHWTSVIVQGRYEELVDRGEGNLERTRAHDLLREKAMWWEPACVATPHLVAAEKVIPIYYRVHVDQMSGRRASPDRVEALTLVEPGISPKSEGWLKSLLRRARFDGPKRSSRVYRAQGPALTSDRGLP